MKKARQKYSHEFKDQIINKYYAGEITAAQLASEHNLHTDTIHRWKYEREYRRRNERRDELQSVGRAPQDVRYIMELEEENNEYKKKVGELLIEVDLLKKVRALSKATQNVSGLEKIKKELGLSRGRVK